MKSSGRSSPETDQLSRFSTAVTRQVSRVTEDARAHLGPAFEDWLRLGAELANLGRAARDTAALAYFSIPPARAAEIGLESLRRWVSTARTVAESSHSLAAAFCETTAPLLGAVDVAATEVWAREGLRLYGSAGLDRDLLAHAFFAAGGGGLQALSPSEYSLWTRLGQGLRPVMKPADFYESLPEETAAWSREHRTAYLDCALTLSERAPRVAAAFYRGAPKAVRSIPPELRSPLLQICGRVARDAPADLELLIPVLGVLVLAVPPAHRAVALDIAGEVARRFPPGAAVLLRLLHRLCEDAPPEHLREWMERGLTLAAANAAAGRAYFALESRTSLKILRGSPASATLEEVQGVVRKFILMLSGDPAAVRPVDEFRLSPALEESPAASMVALPAAISCLDTHEDNARLYRVLAAQLAGRREFGTYEPFSDEAEGFGVLLLRSLRSPERSEALEDFFLLADGYRVACRLVHNYPGLAVDLRWAAQRFLGLWLRREMPSRALLLDAVLALALGPESRATVLPSWLRTAGRILLPCLAPLASARATSRDALEVAELLTVLLPRLRAQLTAAAEAGGGADITVQAGAGRLGQDERVEGGGDAASSTATDDGVPEDAPIDIPPDLRIRLGDATDDALDAAGSLSAEELARLLDAIDDVEIAQARGDDDSGAGLPTTQLTGKLRLEERTVRGARDAAVTTRLRPRPPTAASTDPIFVYDEWDYLIDDYRHGWCRLQEMTPEGDVGDFFTRVMAEYAPLVPEIRRQFQRVRPEAYQLLRGLEDGDDIDLNAVVTARADARAKRPPSPKLYAARTQRERDVATLFLLDMSASTDEPAAGPASGGLPDAATHSSGEPKRIIDVTKEALVILATALEEIGDAYGIYGFSGYGRDDVEFYVIKSFAERLTPTAKGRLGAVQPKRSTRMGTALRHARAKMADLPSLAKHLILLSDGFPQDFDYGEDRRTHSYGIRDTAMALREADAAGIRPFCITVDRAGHDYLRDMCDASRYMVIENVTDLPRELPKIYRQVVRAA